VLKLVDKCLEAGVDFVAIADTVGYAGPKQVGELTKAAVKLSGAKPVCVHLHDTRGMGIANASAALDAGARILDGSLGGLGVPTRRAPPAMWCSRISRSCARARFATIDIGLIAAFDPALGMPMRRFMRSPRRVARSNEDGCSGLAERNSQISRWFRA
jgi:hypothetical protein